MEPTKNSSNTILAIVVCMLIWIGWQYYLEKKYPQPATAPEVAGATTAPQQAESEKAKQEVVVKKETTKAVVSESIQKPETQTSLENEKLKLTLSSNGGIIKEALLKKEQIYLINPKTDKGALALKVLKNAEEIDFSSVSFDIKQKSENEVELGATKQGVKLVKNIKFNPENYTLNVNINAYGATENIKSIEVFSYSQIPEKETSSFLSFSPPEHYQEYFFFHKNKIKREHVSHDSEVKVEYDQSSLAALGTRYFTTLYLNRALVMPNVAALREQGQSVLKIKYPFLENAQNIKFDLFLGPKSLKLLKSIDQSAAEIIDYGIFSWIALPLLGIMKWFYSMIGNYGIAIILLTLLVRVLTFPFTYVSYKSMKAMQVIQPEINKLKEKYKGDNKTLNVEMMRLMRENKVNPAGGCVPMLLQLPIFWALYQVLQNSIELYRSPFYFWINDLSQKDPYYVLPVLMGIAMFAQQKMMPSTMDPAQQKVMLFMPIFFAFLMFGLPSGLTLYILISTLFGIAQQLLMTNTKLKKET
ncbi:MAG: membrane protein insertase YidC [Oligoflexia bacterium]|nr:membrane protein insertase YidC [Oligoflexia bacterium]